MSNNSNEQERLRRLRERQLADRDPLVKEREFQRRSVAKERKAAARRYTLRDAWSEIPHIIKGPLYGFLLGLGVCLVLPALWQSPWALPCGAGLAALFIGMGALLGRAVDSREDIKDNLR
ncbi:MAG: hypothetical protein JXB85_10080 [Anaerolineales bacterium]|nr:hypothetical protein [Anaerolineales bacterium]